MCQGTAIQRAYAQYCILLWLMHIRILHQCNFRLPNVVSLASFVMSAEQASRVYLWPVTPFHLSVIL